MTDKTKPSMCLECIYWVKDRGVLTFTGWTGAGWDDGYCKVEPVSVPRKGHDIPCRHGEKK
jgi:hypothetical protein